MENQPKTKSTVSSEEVKRARRIAIVLASLICLAIIFLMYGQIQKTAADANLALAKQYKIEAEEQHKLVSETRDETMMLRHQLAEAVTALQECMKNQK